MKKVWKYIIITLLLLLGLCCVGVLYLFFVPNSSLFNITYINYNETKESANYSVENVSKIELDSRAYEINIIKTDTDIVSLKVLSNSFGFVLNKNKGFDVDSKLENGVLTFTVTEPHGFATSNLSKIELSIPTTKAIDLSLSNKKARTTINLATAQINNFKYKTENGDLNFKSGKINGSINLNLGKSDVKFYEAVETTSNEVDLQLTSGSFKAETQTFGNINITKNERGVISIKECETLRENQKSAGGQINIQKATHIYVKAGDTKITVDEISDAATVDLTKSGSIKINKLNGESSISTNSGNINLGTTYSPLTLYSESGNINVSNAMLTVVVTLNYGEANISFANEAESYLTNNNARVLYATIKNGTLHATGVEHVGEVVEESETSTNGGIKITGNGRVTIRMNNVYGKNSVEGNNGIVNLVINKNSAYTLKTSSAGGYVRVNLTQIKDYNGYTDKDLTTTNVNCSTSSHVLYATTNYGDLTILDTNFA